MSITFYTDSTAALRMIRLY
jgi:UDP-sugar transporter A1/2/3